MFSAAYWLMFFATSARQKWIQQTDVDEQILQKPVYFLAKHICML